MSKKQLIVALSTTEAEYIVAANCAPQRICCNNKSAIALCKNAVFHGRSKHIDIWFHKIWESIAEVLIDYYHTEEQVAYIFVKLLKIELFCKLEKMLTSLV